MAKYLLCTVWWYNIASWPISSLDNGPSLPLSLQWLLLLSKRNHVHTHALVTSNVCMLCAGASSRNTSSPKGNSIDITPGNEPGFAFRAFNGFRVSGGPQSGIWRSFRCAPTNKSELLSGPSKSKSFDELVLKKRSHEKRYNSKHGPAGSIRFWRHTGSVNKVCAGLIIFHMFQQCLTIQARMDGYTCVCAQPTWVYSLRASLHVSACAHYDLCRAKPNILHTQNPHAHDHKYWNRTFCKQTLWTLSNLYSTGNYLHSTLQNWGSTINSDNWSRFSTNSTNSRNSVTD